MRKERGRGNGSREESGEEKEGDKEGIGEELLRSGGKQTSRDALNMFIFRRSIQFSWMLCRLNCNI